MIDFRDKKILILGVANERSIAWGIATALHQAGAELAFTYVGDAIEKRVRPLAESINCNNIYKCDVQSDDDIKALYHSIESKWGKLDGIVHSVAFAEREDLQNRFCETTRSGFHTALDISAYSLISIAGKLLPLFKDGGSILTMSYLGSQRVVSNYKVMGVAKAALEASVKYLAADLGEQGVRVNAISAGPIKTLAASGIPKFKELLQQFAEMAPLKKNVSVEEVAQTSLYFLSPLSSGITGEVTYVDCGFNIIGL